MNVGCPHFEGELRKYRQADYNIYKSLYEFIDLNSLLNFKLHPLILLITLTPSLLIFVINTV